ncbi:DUF6356 family protein [uncultured Sphingomonas sp.]|uniref:DUF6356 family protein n=1 Tax=uncultured Sphingomonas sp. TaxID=158754 RepID=UPI0015762247
MLNRLFLDHPRSVGESYSEHMAVAGSFGMAMIAGGLACLVHAVLPCTFTSTGSGIVRRLYQRMVTNRTAAGTTGAIVAAE